MTEVVEVVKERTEVQSEWNTFTLKKKEEEVHWCKERRVTITRWNIQHFE